jgi:hypothetical protein
MRCKCDQPPAETLIEVLFAVEPNPERWTPALGTEAAPERELLTKAASRVTVWLFEPPHDQP